MKLDILKLTNFRSFETFEIKLNSDINILFSKNEEYNSNILDAISISLSCFVSRLPKVSGLLFKDSDLLIN